MLSTRQEETQNADRILEAMETVVEWWNRRSILANVRSKVVLGSQILQSSINAFNSENEEFSLLAGNNN